MKTRKPGEGDNVRSIVTELERRQLDHVRRLAEKSHRRELEAMVEAADVMHKLGSGDFDAMVAELEASDDPEAIDTLARLRCARAMRSCVHGDEAAGFAEWEALMAEHPRMALPWVMRARWWLQNKDQPQRALEDLERAVTIEPKDPGPYFWRAKCHEKLGDPERALANFRRAAALDAGSVDVQHALAKALSEHGSREEAKVAWNRLIAAAPGYVDFHLGRARVLEEEGAYGAALADYDRIVELDPSSHGMRFCRAICLSLADRVPEALAAMEETSKMAPDTPMYLRALGDLRVRAGDARGGLAALSRALELEPDADGYAARGRAHEALGDPRSALADYDRAAELDPHDEVVQVHRLALRTKEFPAEQDPEQVVADIEQLADNVPGSATIHELLATLRTALGDHEDALTAWNRAIELAGEEAEGSAFLSRAVEHARLGQVQEAFDDASRAIERSPDLAGAWVARGIYRTHLEEDFEAALADLDRAVSLAPDDGAARFHRGEIRCSMEDYEGALEDFDRAVAIAPTVGKIYAERAECREQLGDDDGAEADRARAVELGYDPDEEDYEDEEDEEDDDD